MGTPSFLASHIKSACSSRHDGHQVPHTFNRRGSPWNTCWLTCTSGRCRSSRANSGMALPTRADSNFVGSFPMPENSNTPKTRAVSYTHLRAHETDSYLVCRLLLEQ